MAPTEGRVAKPERWWGCRCGTPQKWHIMGLKNDKSTIFEALHDMEYNTVARFPFR